MTNTTRILSLVACALLASAVGLSSLHAQSASLTTVDAPDMSQADGGHSLYHQYYQYWENQRGTHCCNNQHCRPSKARWSAARGWEALTSIGTWVQIQPGDDVKDDGGLGPFATVCDISGDIICFDPPDATF